MGNVGDKDEPDCTSKSGDKELNCINPFQIKFKEGECRPGKEDKHTEIQNMLRSIFWRQWDKTQG